MTAANNAALGRTRWAIAEGYIPGWSNGPEPELQSHENCCTLNAGSTDAQISLMLYFEDREPQGPYRFTVPAQRACHKRFNDLQDPAPVPRGVGFFCVIGSEVPVVVQHTRLDSRQADHGEQSYKGHRQLEGRKALMWPSPSGRAKRTMRRRLAS